MNNYVSHRKQDALNESISTLNTTTLNYYTQLKWATWIIAIATALNIFAPFLPKIFEKNKNKQPLQSPLTEKYIQQRIDTSLKLQKEINSSLNLMVKKIDTVYVKHR